MEPKGINLSNFCGSESYRTRIIRETNEPILKGIHEVHRDKIRRNVKELGVCVLALIVGEPDSEFYEKNQRKLNREAIENSLKVKIIN